MTLTSEARTAMGSRTSYWYAELVAIVGGFVPTKNKPGTLSRDTIEPVDGFYRMMGATTKWDTPVGIWCADGHEAVVLQIGRETPKTLAPDADDFWRFRSQTFLSCAAVRRADWDSALKTGFWPDGKLSRNPIEIKDRAALVDYLRTDIDMLIYKKASEAAKRGETLPGCTILTGGMP